MVDPSQFYVHPGADLLPGLTGLAQTVQAYGQTKKAEDAAQAAAAKEEALKTEVARLVREGTSQEISEFAVQNPEWGQLVRNESSLRDEGNARTMVNMYYASIDNPSKIPQFLDAYEARLSIDGLTEQESEEIADARQRASSDPEGYLKSMELSVAGLDPERHTQYSSIKAEPEEDLTTTQKEYKTAKSEGYPGSFMDYQRETNPTTAIQEYEYGIANPDYVLGQKAEEQETAVAAAKAASYGSETTLRKEFLSQASEYQTVRDSYKRVLKSTEDPTPAGDLSLIFNYMKMLDPGSVVRESEFQTAASAGSYGDRIQAAVQRGLSGERLTEDMRADFLNKSEALFDGMGEQHTKREETYRGIAVNNGLNPNMVVTDIRRPIEEEDTATIDTGANPTIGTRADYDNLPPGALYVNQSTGKLMRKP